MHHRRRFIFAASVAALVLAGVAGPTVSAGTAAESSDAPATGASIVYTDLYLKLIAAYPSGWVLDSCGAVLEVTGRTGVCPAILQLEYFYPDGTFGPRPWHADASSPTGWSVEPDPCASLTEEEYLLWLEYDAFVNGYADTGPELTDEQIALYGYCWPMGF